MVEMDNEGLVFIRPENLVEEPVTGRFLFAQDAPLA